MNLENFKILDYLINPVANHVYWEKYWERDILHVKRNTKNYFKDIIDKQQIDELLFFIKLNPENISLAINSKPIDKIEFVKNGVVNINSVLDLHKKGATIILRSINLYIKTLEEFRRKLEATIKLPIQTNIYLTPPTNQSAPPHWDTHDIFILQVEGTKVWKIYETDYQLPLSKDFFYVNETSYGKFKENYLLEPGDTFYIPRGTIHEPISETYSIHISVGIMAKRLIDYLSDYLQLLSHDDIELRKIYIPSFDFENNQSNRSIYNKICSYIPKHKNNKDLELKFYHKITDDFVKAIKVQPTIGFTNNKLKKIELDSYIKLRDDIVIKTSINDKNYELSWLNNNIIIPLSYKNVIDNLLKLKHLKVIELSSDISSVDLIAFVSELYKLNFIYIE